MGRAGFLTDSRRDAAAGSAFRVMRDRDVIDAAPVRAAIPGPLRLAGVVAQHEHRAAFLHRLRCDEHVTVVIRLDADDLDPVIGEEVDVLHPKVERRSYMDAHNLSIVHFQVEVDADVAVWRREAGEGLDRSLEY